MADWISILHAGFRKEDLIDVLIVSIIIYKLLTLIQGTRAVQMLLGLGVLAAAYFLSSTFEFYATHWLLNSFFDYFVFVAIILFQDDLRRAVSTIGKNPFSRSTEAESRLEMVEEISRAAVQLAKNKIGALMVIERNEGLKNFIDTGSILDARVRTEILYSIFIPDSPIHDGAVIIMDDRIAAAGCFLPLSKNTNIDKQLGTRHRAAIGITEDTDAVVVLASEESGQIQLVHDGKMVKIPNENQLKNELASLLGLNYSHRSWLSRVKEGFTR